MSGKFGETYYDLTLNALRIMAGFLFMTHGGGKLFGWFGAEGSFTQFWPFGVAGILEFFGGLAIALGLYTRYVAFVVAGEMAVAYFWRHVGGSGSIWPWVNRGELPVLYCFIWLFIWASGGGSKTLDAWLARRKALVLALVALGALAAPAVAQQTTPTPTIQEWNVPWARTRPRDPYLDAQGRIWFVGQTGHYVGMLDPTTGEFKKFDLAPGTGPHNLILDGAGIVWYSGNASSHIGRLDPKDGSITRIPMADSAARDPHTMVWDRHGDVWFTVQGGNFIGKLTVATGKMRLVAVPTPRARPYGIALDRAGRPWIVLFGTNKIATVDPETFALTEYPLPRAEARPRRMAITSDGAIWYGDYAGGMLGRFDPRTKQVEEWPLPGGTGARPYAVTVDDQDRIWVVETGSQPNRFVGFDTRARRFLPGADVPSGGGTIRNMVFDPRARVIWFGSDANTIGRAQLPNPPATPVP